MTLYSEKASRIIHSYDWPPGNRLWLDPADGLDAGGNPCLVLYIYRDNFITFDGTEQLRIAKIFNSLIPQLISEGIPTRLEVLSGGERLARG